MRLSDGSGGAADGAAAALPAGGGSVEVTGNGALAVTLRARLGARACAGSRPPQAAIDTTGDPAVIGDLLARVADLGTVVLAGPPPAGGAELDLYRDVHVRGLTVTGVADEKMVTS